jgi:hypothetical protein
LPGVNTLARFATPFAKRSFGFATTGLKKTSNLVTAVAAVEAVEAAVRATAFIAINYRQQGILSEGESTSRNLVLQKW